MVGTRMIGGKRANRIESLTNQTSIYAIVGGLGRTVGGNAAINNRGRHRWVTELISPWQPVLSFNYMREHNLLSVNPTGSGGVGKMTLLINRNAR